MVHLNEHIEKIEKEIAEITWFQNDVEYAKLEQTLLDAFNRSDLEAIKKITSDIELRRVPHAEGFNTSSRLEEL